MKKFSFVFLGLTILLCATVTACSGKSVPDESASAIIDVLVPEKITNVELSGFYNGVVEPRALNQAEIEQLCEWYEIMNTSEPPLDLPG